VIDGVNDTFLGIYNRGKTLAAGESYTTTVNINIPYDLSKTKLVVWTDNGSPYGYNNFQAEITKDNNIRTLDQPFLKADLAITDFKILDPQPTWGQSAQISWTVTNQGGGNANQNWYDNVWISADGVIDGVNDTFLGIYNRGKTLAAGESYTTTTNINIPYDLSKTKLVVLTDNGSPYGYNNFQAEITIDNDIATKIIGLQTPLDSNPADLTITELILSSTSTLGETVPITWKVKNQGNFATTVNWADYLYASDDDKFDLNDVFIGMANNPNNTILNPGESYTNTQSFKIPGAVAGKRYLLAITNRDRQQAETNSANNVYAIDVLGDPDLTITNATAPGNASAGETVAVAWTVKNEGTHNAIGNWFDAVYLSNDTIIDSTDILITSDSQGAATLKPGESYTTSRNITIPIAAAGQQYLLFATNRTGSQRETNLTNNIKAVRLNGDLADLVVSQITVPANALQDWFDYIYASSDDKLDSTDTIVGYGKVDTQTPLAAGNSYIINQTITIPLLAVGKPYLLFVADRNNFQKESNEENNINSFVLNASDLAVTNISAPTTANWGSTIPVSWTVTNQGGLATSTTWKDGIYLSNSSTFDASAILVKEVNVGATSLAGGASYTQNANITLPSNFTGKPYLFIVSNSQKQLAEAGYSNNIKGLALNVQAPDLVVTNFTTPAQITPGEVVNLSWTVSNQGSFRTDSNWRDRVYLSTDDFVTNDDLLLADLGVIKVLQIGDTYTLSTQVTIPLINPNQNWKLLVKADANSNQVEVVEDNNVAIANIVVVAPDLQVTNFATPATGILGQSVQVSWTVNNTGSSAATHGWQDSLYLSKNNVLGADDLLLKTVVRNTPLATSGSYEQIITATLPLNIDFSTGNYYLLVKTDSNGQQPELSEDNNLAISSPILLSLPPLPDLGVSNLQIPLSGFGGREIAVTWTETNAGEAILNSARKDRIYLSDNAQLTNPRLLGEFTFSDPLSVGGTVTRQQLVTLPTDKVGDYFIIVQVDSDNQIFEAGREQNNLIVGSIAVNRLPDPDLQVTSIDYPTSAQPNTNQTVSWAVRNTSLGDVSGSWNDRVYWSIDGTLNNSQLLATVTHSGGLGSEATYQASANITGVQIKKDGHAASDIGALKVATGNSFGVIPEVKIP
jgi:large repetitive protein